MKRIIITASMLAVFLTSATQAQTTKTQSPIALLQEESNALAKQIEQAQLESDKYTGGSIKANIESRISILKLTKALIDQRSTSTKTGAKLKIEAPATTPQPEVAATLIKEIETIDKRIAETQSKADQYTGGLIQAQILSTIATMNETRAILERKMLTAKYGLAFAQENSPQTTTISASNKDKSTKKTTPISEQLIMVNAISKQYNKRKYDYFISFDLQFTAAGIPKPTRAIKGSLVISDLFGEEITSISWPLDDPMEVGSVKNSRNEGFEFNQFKSEQIRVRDTENANLKYTYRVKSIIFQDGTREDF